MSDHPPNDRKAAAAAVNGSAADGPLNATGGTSRRELDQRYSDGVLTTLEWCEYTGELWVRCEQDGVPRPLLCCRVAPADASRALCHPFAYAYARLVSATDAVPARPNGRRTVEVEVEDRQRRLIGRRRRWARWMRVYRRLFSAPAWTGDDLANLPEAWG